MGDFDPIIKNISRFIQLTKEEEKIFSSHLRLVKIRKKQFVVQPDFVCQYRNYIVKGAMRAFLVDKKGEEHTIALAIEDWWISDFSSYTNQEPATLFVEALENSTVIQLSYKDEQMLYDELPKFERFFRLLAQRATAATQKRMLSSISKSAEQRYDEFVSKYPQFLQKIPQYVLASYLGMTTQFLSKIRNQKTKN